MKIILIKEKFWKFTNGYLTSDQKRYEDLNKKIYITITLVMTNKPKVHISKLTNIASMKNKLISIYRQKEFLAYHIANHKIATLCLS